MLSLEQIKDGVSIIAAEYPIKKAELFGSYANGSNRPDSNVDLLVEFPTKDYPIPVRGTRYYLCRGGACARPVSSISKLEILLHGTAEL